MTAYVEWVLGKFANGFRAVHRYGNRSGNGSDLCAQRLNGEFGGRIAFADLAGKQTSYTGGPHGISGPQRHACNGPPASNRARAFRKSGRGARSVRGVADVRSNCAPAHARRVVFFLGQTENKEQARELLQQYRAKDLDQALQRGHKPAGTTFSAPCRLRRPIEPWICCSIAGCSTRRFPAACGRARDFIR